MLAHLKAVFFTASLYTFVSNGHFKRTWSAEGWSNNYVFFLRIHMGEKTVTGGYHPLPPVPEDQICVSLNICIHSFMNYVIEAAPELTKNV